METAQSSLSMQLWKVQNLGKELGEDFPHSLMVMIENNQDKSHGKIK